MTITAQRILTELGNCAWSGFNADDMIFSSDDAMQAKTELNKALRYLLNLEDFPFKAKEKALKARANVPAYTDVEGKIDSIYNESTLEKLEFISDSENYDKTRKGTPTAFWIEYNNPSAKIRLYPIPDENINYKVLYDDYKPVITQEGQMAYEFLNASDFLNMPEKLEYLFMDCLVLRTIITNNADEQDENYAPKIKEFNEVWNSFKKAYKPVKIEHRVVW